MLLFHCCLVKVSRLEYYQIMAVQLLISRPLLACDWLQALRAMIGANYQSVTSSSCGSLYCEQLCNTLVVELLTKCRMQ